MSSEVETSRENYLQVLLRDSSTPLGMTMRGDFPRKIGGEIPGITLLQFRKLPVFAGENFSAIGRAAFAFERVIVVIGHRPIVSELFARADVAHGHECDLAAHVKVGIARMIRIQHRQLALLIGDGRDEKIVVDLNFHGAKPGRDFFAQSFSINNVAAFHRNDFVFCNVSHGE